jgi:hypothetical protein
MTLIVVGGDAVDEDVFQSLLMEVAELDVVVVVVDL